MQIEILKISDLQAPEKNVRIHTKTQIIEIQRSVNMFGQTRPIVVDENNVVLCGNGLWRAMSEMGAETITAVRKTDLTESQKKKLMIADNKTYTLGVDDLEVLTEFINDLKDELDIPGYDEGVLQSMVAEAEDITEKIGDFGIINQEERDRIQKMSERREQMMVDGVKPLVSTKYDIPTSQGVPPSQPVYSPQVSQNEEKFIICPKCGEKICVQ